MKITKLINLFDTKFGKPAKLLFIFIFWGLISVSAQPKIPSQDPGHKEDSKIQDVKFSVPNRFNLEKSTDSRVAFLRHEEYDHLALFVAVPDKQIDAAYLTGLSNYLVSQLLPAEKNFKWKLLSSGSADKISKYQTSAGTTKGLNEKIFVQSDYITVKVKGHEILVGYITRLGDEKNAKFLFDLKGIGGLSMPGWYAQAHIIASLTGEKYEKINPGTYFLGTPAPKKN
jgi:hypothetical protein